MCGLPPHVSDRVDAPRGPNLSAPTPASPLAVRYPTAFVTGASGGLGFAFAELLLERGVRVWGTARDAVRLDFLRGRAGFTPVVLELSDGHAVQDAFERAADEAGGAFDLLINNAGYGLFAPFAAHDFDAWERQLNGMLTQTMRLSHRMLRRWLRRGPGSGAVVNVSSLAAEFPIPYMSGYNVVKAGLSAFSESLIFETRGTDVIVIDFRPGDYRTSFNRSMSATAVFDDQPRLQPIWRTLEANLQTSPAPMRAARDLERALLRGRSGVVRSGTFFQATLAPFLSRFAPLAWRRAAMARYFGAT